MSKAFIHDDFLLGTRSARRLFHEVARDLPIIDYHSHLPPAWIAEDARFENLTQAWLYGDHYKWRAMRANGVAERYCTGEASDWEKFEQWAQTVPATLRNPLYHWTHLELRRPFGIEDVLLGPDTARSVWDRANARLAEPGFSCRGILTQMKVEVVCTTDDPTDDLAAHRALAADDTFTVRVLPTFRPDKARAVDDPSAFRAWARKLEAVAEIEVRDFASYLEALKKRHDYFHAGGCRLSDHGLDTAYADDYAEGDLDASLRALLDGRAIDEGAARRFKSAVLHACGRMDHEKGWTQQLHIGPLRNNNTRAFQALGPDTGFDSMDDQAVARPLARMLDRLDREDRLPKTILYNLNPRDNELMATMIGNFQDGITPGKMQYGSGWWFLDQRQGMEAQLNVLSNMGLLSRFVGMLTDSRSFLSFTRHEYFRRILCNLLGSEMEEGSLPDDFDLVAGLVRDVCHDNAERYFGFA